MHSADRMLKRYERMKSDRVYYERDWEFVAKYFNPARAKFFDTKLQSSDRRMDWRFTGDGERYSALMSESFASFSFPKGERFFDIEFFGLHAETAGDERAYAQEMRDALDEIVTATETRFHDHVPEVIRDWADFGIGVLYEEDVSGLGDLRYRRWGLHSVWLDVDNQGEHNAIAHKYKLSAEQAVKEFGEAVGEKVVKASRNDPESMFDYLHFICKHGERWYHYHLDCENKRVLKQKGSSSSQVYTPRFKVDPDSPYCWGLGNAALDDIDGLNDMEADKREASQLDVAPPILVGNEDHLSEGYLQSRQLIYSDFTNGRPHVQPLQMGGNLPFQLEDIQVQTNKVGDRYLYNIWRMSEQKGISATQFAETREMYDHILGPWFQRLATQLAEPLLKSAMRKMLSAEREYWEEHMPSGVAEVGGFDAIRFRFTSPMAGAAKVKKGMGMQRVIEGLGNYAQLSQDPSVFDNIDPDKFTRGLADAYNVDLDFMRTSEELEELRKGRAEAQEAQQQMEQAPAMMDAMQKASEIGVAQ